MMGIQFIINDEGEKTAIIIPINEYENLLHQRHLNFEITDEYKTMIDKMLQQEADGSARYVSLSNIKSCFFI
ncbi:hypothetical protein [Mucilaginibacter sp. OK098]|uniref:hypothetical protein n=1 Tax=Mucilaginibacter sp. OK098 TaxID=1855297 RepID=UPI0009172A7B|nr:hypothetical protein [Mucilaginibacter sp. OK098]SHN37276.1 hypothetical protein SAMN05216524_11520 [Mucilaginibacter sp. OK098]